MGEERLSTSELRRLRERFVADPEGTDLSDLRPLVERSWRRSHMWNIDPFGEDLFKTQKPKLDELVRICAEPVMAELERMAQDTGSGVFLSDPLGTIADFRGDPALRRVTERVFPTFGATMSEDVAGTNAEGTALEEGRSVQIWGSEHFTLGMENFCCTAVPIKDPLRGSVRGFLSLTIPEKVGQNTDPRAIALIVEGAAAEITRTLATKLAVREKTLLETYLTEVRKRGAESVVVMDDKTTIATRAATEQLMQEDFAVLAGYAREAVQTGRLVEQSVVFESGQCLQLQAWPISSAGESVGSLIKLRRSETTSPKRSKRVSLRTDPFDNVVGESLVLRRAVELANIALARRMPAHINGEAGTGKYWLAQAIVEKIPGGYEVFESGSEQERMAEELELALNDGKSIIIRNVEMLPELTKQKVAEVLSNHRNPSVVVTSTRQDEGTAEIIRALGGVEIDMPSLRKRRDDIPRLALESLKSENPTVSRISPQFVRAITEADWPGNVRQLQAFIHQAIKQCRTRELTLDQLTETQRKGLEGSRLSRLEEVELQQIREALAEASGNRVKAADLLQIGRSTLYRKIDFYTRRGFKL